MLLSGPTRVQPARGVRRAQREAEEGLPRPPRRRNRRRIVQDEESSGDESEVEGVIAPACGARKRRWAVVTDGDADDEITPPSKRAEVRVGTKKRGR